MRGTLQHIHRATPLMRGVHVLIIEIEVLAQDGQIGVTEEPLNLRQSPAGAMAEQRTGAARD